ncbi:MAG: tRNA dimethylallyltransferase, partial [Bryocella sp.]
AGYLHRVLTRLDVQAAQAIHANDTPKLVRAIEVSLLARKPQREQWTQGRDPLTGYRVVQIGLTPPREALYGRINRRAAEMFERGLVAETKAIVERFGDECRALTSLGYAQALGVMRGELTMANAVAAAQQGHRNYAKRQMTWFRRDAAIHWLPMFGADDEAVAQALQEFKDRM